MGSMMARHSKVYAGWGTPEAYIDAAREVMGGIDLDPASDAGSQARIKAGRILTVEDDGLVSSWADARTVWINPPGGLARPFWRRLTVWVFDDPRRTRQAIWLGYSLEQLQTLQTDGNGPIKLADAVCFPSKRIAFYDAAGVLQKSPTHANYVAYFGVHVNRFNEVFGAFGEVL